MPIIVNVHIHLGRAYFKTRGVKKDSVPDMIEIELTNISDKSGIRSLVITARMREVGYQGQQLQNSQEVYIKVY